VSIFVDTSVWFAAAAKGDRSNEVAKSVLQSVPDHVTTDHVLIETWLLLNSRFGRDPAEVFWERIRSSSVHIEPVTSVDLEAAWTIGSSFPKRDFSLIDRTSLAVMHRLGIVAVATFDDAFAAFRYGRARDKALEIIRSGHSTAFQRLSEAIIHRMPVTLTYEGRQRQVYPHILGHAGREERALAFEYDGSKSSKRQGQWCCLRLSEIDDKDIQLQDGPWRTGKYPSTTQRCVDKLYLDADECVPNQPGRRFHQNSRPAAG
jgi:predicted nucleic acid-binding protein